MRRGLWLAMAAACSFNACWQTLDSASLQASSPAPPAQLGCSACHPYSLQDADHFTHLVYDAGDYVKQANGFITCLDCHRASLRYRTEILFDSIYRDSDGALWSSVDSRGSGRNLPGTLLRVDTLAQHHPIPVDGKAPKEGELQEWMTGIAHLNGTVDVDFDSTASDPARYGGARARFNPALETCSAVSCHVHDGPYRFEACSKGLPELVGGAGPEYQCVEKP